jgi:hypothetical protein
MHTFRSNPENRPLARTISMCKGNIKMDVKEEGRVGMD